ncbi:prenyltransferase [Deltaproteobacteria bacterium]|nr:prenyltransferase [Deltaproteobacteria bacterium]
MNPYIKAVRAPFLVGSLMPVIIGTCLAFTEKYFSLPNFLLALVGVASLHLAANLINDYYDAMGSDPMNLRVTPFSGGSRVIQDGELGAVTIFTMSIFFLVLSLTSAILLMYAGKPLVLLLGLLGLFAGWSYSAPPLQLMSRGWGEIVIFFAFGPLVTLGAYYVNTGSMSLEAFALGFPQGFLIMGVIWINQFPDYQADKAAGKKNLVVRLGPGISRYLYCMIMILSFISVVLLVGIMKIHYLIMLAFISFPLVLRAIGIAWKEYLSYDALIPAQALTIQTIIAQGLLISFGLFLRRLVHV